MQSAINIHYFYEDSSQSLKDFNRQVYSENGAYILQSVYGYLQGEADSASSSTVIILQALVAIGSAVLTVVTGGVASGVIFAGLMTAGAALAPLLGSEDDSALEFAFADAATSVQNGLSSLGDANAKIQDTVLNQYGLLMAHGGSLGNTGNFFPDAESYQACIDAAVYSFKVWCWQQLTPYAWQRVRNFDDFISGSYDGPREDAGAAPSPNGGGAKPTSYILQATKGKIASATTNHVFNSATGNPSGLAITPHEVLHGLGGWHKIAYVDYTGAGSVLKTPAHRIETRVVSLTRNDSGVLTATLTLANKGYNSESNVMIVGAKLNRRITMNALPTRHIRLAVGYSRTIVLQFPASTGPKGAAVPLQITGKYVGGSFGGSLRVKLP